MKLKIERNELVIKIQSNMYDGAFSRKLIAKSFIEDIRPGSKYPSYEQNKSYFKSRHFRYSHVLYRIIIMEKFKKFDLLPHDFI